MKKTISKSEWLSAEHCMTKAWFGLRNRAPVPDEVERFQMEQGQEVGALARKLYPYGILIPRLDAGDAAEVTRDLISAGAHEIFEATFVAGPFIAKADILQRENGGWHVLEVKSRFSDTGDLDELMDDLAYTVTIAKRSGLSVTTASLLLLSRDYRFGGGPEALFDRIDVTADVIARALTFQSDADSRAQALLAETSPKPKLVSACRDCAYFDSICLGAGIAHTVFEIPSLSPKKLKRLSAESIVGLADLPEDIGLNEKQERARESVLSSMRIIEPTLAGALETISWPCFYLDFETLATTLPPYHGYGCHEQVLTQFSVHRRNRIDGEILHREFLAEPSRDCQRELAVALIDVLDRHGSIIVYSNFEKVRITALRDRYPDLAQSLQDILDRLVDLLPIVAHHVFDPGFKGSFSIKKVLPALAPDLSYAALEIRDGGTAIARFARMARGEIVGREAEEAKRALLEYCKLDTLAMVRLHEALCQISSGPLDAAARAFGPLGVQPEMLAV